MAADAPLRRVCAGGAGDGSGGAGLATMAWPPKDAVCRAESYAVSISNRLWPPAFGVCDLKADAMFEKEVAQCWWKVASDSARAVKPLKSAVSCTSSTSATARAASDSTEASVRVSSATRC